MAAQEIYITPRQILSYLKDFEERLPLPHKDYYISSLRNTPTPLTIEALNNEVNRMAEFIGMTGFTASCKWAKLPKGVGGQIKLDNSRNGVLDIEVNEEYRLEVDVTAATLAHELCHKYLQLYGIYFPTFTEINETYTDLCTIYVGFGNVIMKGYSTEKWKSGYLQYPIYKRTNNLVRMIIWGEKNGDIKEQSEPFLEEALASWIRNMPKQQISRIEYIHAYSRISKFHSNMEILNQLVSMLTESPIKVANDIDEKLYNSNWFNEDGSLLHKVECFVGVYESMINRAKLSDSSISSVNRYLEHLIVQLVDAIGRDKFINNKIRQSNFSCPYCNHRALTSKITNCATIVKCPKCGKRFAVNTTDFDLISARNDFNRYKEELILPMRRGYDEAKEREKKSSYLKGFSDGKEHKGKELDVLKKKIDNLPSWIKWLIGSRLK